MTNNIFQLKPKKKTRPHILTILRELLTFPGVNVDMERRTAFIGVSLRKNVSYDGLLHSEEPVDLLIAAHIDLKQTITTALDARIAALVEIRKRHEGK